MENVELESLLADLESDRVDRKASLSVRDKIRQAICAFVTICQIMGKLRAVRWRSR